MKVTIDRFGRMVLPKKLRDGLGLMPGDVLEVCEAADAIVLRPVCEKDPLVEKGGVLVHTGTPTGNVEEAVRSQREDRLTRLRTWQVPG